MTSPLKRVTAIFNYGNLKGDNRDSIDMDEANRDGIMSSSSKVRQRKKCIWISSIFLGLTAIIIIALTVKNRHDLQDAVAEALVKRENFMSQLNSQNTEQEDTRRKIQFSDFLRYTFYPDSYNGTWLSDNEIMYLDSVGSLSIHNLKTKRKNILIEASTFLRLHPISYEFSADRKYLLVKEASQKVWRRSSIGSYVLIKFLNGYPQTNRLIPLEPSITDNEIDSNKYLRYVSWAPTGNGIAYVDYNNNLHYRETAEGNDIQLTTSGIDGVIYNGIPDWVSEEEVFEDNKALWWSPDGSRLVYGVFNDTLVESVTLPRYGSWRNDKADKQGYPFLQYTLQETIKYPKAGRENPSVELWSANVGNVGENGNVQQLKMTPPVSMEGKESHFSSVAWRDDHTAAVVWMNRLQNVTAVSVCSLLDTAGCQEIFNMPVRDGWVDYHFSVKFNKYIASSRFLAILPSNMVYRYRQLFVVEGSSRTQLTNQESEVTEIVEWTADDTVFYVATRPGDPGSRHLYKLRIGQQQVECLTCESSCDFYEASFSNSGSYFTLECKGPGIPFSSVHKASDNMALIKWTDNRGLLSVTSKVQMPKIEYKEIPVIGTDQKAQVMLFLPPHLDKNKKIPLLVDVYGGPGFQKVDKSWKGYDYATYMAGSNNIAYAVIDPRGSGYQGDAWRHAYYRKFGSVEVDDTISVTKVLQETLPYIDSDRTAIWGWSYGGFLSLSVLARDTRGVFKCGASVAPVVRWELYDTVYTERYMGRPVDNPEGYNASTPLWHLDTLRNKKYYLIHGTHDDNVHYQQSMMLSAALEEKDILFKQQAYPDQDHSIGDYRKHLYHSLTSFFTDDCFRMLTQ